MAKAQKKKRAKTARTYIFEKGANVTINVGSGVKLVGQAPITESTGQHVADTKKEIVLRGQSIKLSPGQEMDKLVATEVLGWKIVGDLPANKEGNEKKLIFCKAPGENLPLGQNRVLPLFSTSDHAALDLFKMVRGPLYCCMDISSDYAYCYDVKLTLEIGRTSIHKTDVCVTRESLAEAICVALLEGAKLAALRKAIKEFKPASFAKGVTYPIETPIKEIPVRK
jgi:hypothetical protein